MIIRYSLMIFYDNPYRTMLLFAIYYYTSTLIKINILFTKDIFIAVIYCQIVHNTYIILFCDDDCIHANKIYHNL